MLDYQKLKEMMISDKASFSYKWPVVSSLLLKTNITLLDLLKIMPCMASARIVSDYQKDYFKVVKILQDFIVDRHISINSWIGFSNSDPNLPYKRVSFGDFEGSQELIVHCFIMNEILPKGLFPLLKSGLSDLRTIFFTDLNFDEFLLLKLRHKKNKERPITELQFTTIDEYWARNSIALLKKMEPFLFKAYRKDRKLFEETFNFLEEFKAKLEEDSIECLKQFVVLKLELTSVIDDTLQLMKSFPSENLSVFYKVILCKLKRKTYDFLDSNSLMSYASRDFETDYPNRENAIQFLRNQVENPDFLLEVVQEIGKKLDRIFLKHRTDKLGLFQDIVSLLRFNDLLMFEIPGIDEKYKLLTRITLWRIFNFCLYSDYASVVLGYMTRKSKQIFAEVGVSRHQHDYIYSLFCYIYVMDERKNLEINSRNLEVKQGVIHLLEEVLSMLNLKTFFKSNFFLLLDYDNEQLRHQFSHFVKSVNDISALFESISTELLSSKSFSDKSLLLIAYAKKVLLNLYVNPQNEIECQEGTLKFYATLMLLFDTRELQKIDKKVNPTNFLLIETKLKLIIECFGLIGVFPRSFSDRINQIHQDCENAILKPLDINSNPGDLIRFLQNYVDQNMFYKNINLFAIFKTMQRSEQATQDIQHSQIFFEKVNLENTPNSFDMLKWICKLAVSIPSEFHSAFDMCLEILVGDSEFGFILIPFVLYIYLQNCNEDHVNGLVRDINSILRGGHSIHKMILINAIKQLERWHFDGNQMLQTMTLLQNEKKPQRGRRGGTQNDKSYARLENFCHHFSQIKKLIDRERLILAQANFGDYKSAALNLEKLLEDMTSNSQICDEDCIEKLGLLYSIYSEINEDFKDLDFAKILQRLKIPYNPALLKKYTSQLSVKSSSVKVVDENIIYNDDKLELIADNEIEAWHYIFSKRKAPFNDDSVFFLLLTSLVWVACHFMKTSPEYKTMLEELKAQAKDILQNAKLSLLLSMLMIRNNYNSLYPFFLKAQLLMDFEILFQVFQYTCENVSKINPTLIQSMPIEKETFEISLDEMSDNYFMKTNPTNEAQFHIILFINTCLRRIDKRMQSMETTYKVKLDWMNVTKFMIHLIKENVKYYFDSIYYEFIYKLLKLTFKNQDFRRAEIYHKKLISNVEMLKKPIKCQFLLAKLTKKLKGKKDAIKILNEIRAHENSEKIFEIKAKLKIAKYMSAFYAESDVTSKYLKILSDYQSVENELMYFQYAKFLEETNPNPEATQAEDIARYYLESIKYGHSYIFQSLPRALRMCLDYCLVGVNPKGTKKSQTYQRAHKLVHEVLNSLETYKLVHIIQFLVSRLDHPDDDVVETLCGCLARIASEYPRQSVWWLLPLKYFHFKNTKTEYEKSSKKERAARIFAMVKRNNQESWKIINDSETFYKGLLEFASGNQIPDVLLKETKNSQIILPLRKYLDPHLPKKNFKSPHEFNPFHPNPQFIQCMDSKFQTMPSKEKPKRITFHCTDGKRVPFLLKFEPKGDVRKESRTIDFVNFVNLYLKTSGLTKDKDLKMRSFSIIPLCSKLNLSEWVDNTSTIKSLIESEWKIHGIKNSMRDIFDRFKSNESKYSAKIWEEISKAKLVFQYHFWKSFGDANDWYGATLNYIKTTALWSAFGYLIGLGDRHCDNILLEKTTGEAVHIDFDCIFSKGKDLPVPEIVEFRLTKNIEAPMGAFRCYALFDYYFKLACQVFQKNIDDLLGALDSFVNDPLLENRSLKPAQTLEKIRKRVMFSQNKSLEDGVQQIIEDSKNEECLREMFCGWMPQM